MELQSSSASSAFSDQTKSLSPSQRPSYFDYSSTSGLYPPQNQFDEGVIKQLDLDVTADDSGSSSSAGDDEKLKTFLRIRPVMTGDGDAGSILQVKDEHTVVASISRRNALIWQDGPRKQTEFKFSRILGQECGQSAVFEECVTPIIEKFMRHENCLIFSYGATNSGKTYTMQGHGNEYGIIPRTLDAIFNRLHDRLYKFGNIRPHLYQAFQQLSHQEMQTLCDKRDRIIADANIKQEIMRSYRLTSSGFSDRTGSTVDIVAGGNLYDSAQASAPANANMTLYSIWVSYAELYNERVYDLLEPPCIGKSKRRKDLKLMQDRNGYVYIKDLTEVPVMSDEEAYKVFLAGRKNLQFAATQMNQNSSRSHSFFTIRVVSIGIGAGNVLYPKTVHRMTFCDLAGMERANQTENRGFRLQESGNINNSLTVLLKVIRLLREKQLNNNGPAMIETIPFRESKLTHIFKSYFTSSTHICMLVNVSPDPSVAESTVQVLQNSAIASNVVVFRSGVEAQPLHPLQLRTPSKVLGKPPLPPSSKSSRTPGSSTPRSNSPDTPSDSDDYALPTVVAPKTLLQRLMILEKENKRLKRQLKRSEQEKTQMRENALQFYHDQRKLWMERLQESRSIEENFHQRRVSLLKQKNQLSPASRCGRNSPPTGEMEDIDETLEEEEEEDEEEEESASEDSDKEN